MEREKEKQSGSESNSYIYLFFFEQEITVRNIQKTIIVVSGDHSFPDLAGACCLRLELPELNSAMFRLFDF